MRISEKSVLPIIDLNKEETKHPRSPSRTEERDTDKRRNGYLARIRHDYGFDLHDLIPPWKQTRIAISLLSLADIEAILKVLTKRKYPRHQIIQQFHNLSIEHWIRPPPHRVFHALRLELEHSSPHIPLGTGNSTASAATGGLDSLVEDSSSSTGYPSSSEEDMSSSKGGSSSSDAPSSTHQQPHSGSPPATQATEIHDQEQVSVPAIEGSREGPARPMSSGTSKASEREPLRPENSQESQEEEHCYNSDKGEKHNGIYVDDTEHETSDTEQNHGSPLTPPSSPDQPQPKRQFKRSRPKNNQHPASTAGAQDTEVARSSISTPLSSQAIPITSSKPNIAIQHQIAAVQAWRDRVHRSEVKLGRSVDALKAAQREFHNVSAQVFASSLEERGGESIEELQAEEEASIQLQRAANEALTKARINRLRKWRLATQRRKHLEKYEKGLKTLDTMMEGGCLAGHSGGESSDEEEDGQEEEGVQLHK
ncbi:MAG: hypothetical protein Q9202_007256 [Teloschistes flavicans]